MAYKFCEYCHKNCDSNNTECPSCAAPLENKVYAEDGNFKESLAHGLDKVVSGVSDALFTPPPDAQSGDANGTQRYVNKWITLLLLCVGGLWGAHKLYEERFVMAILYFFTFGLLFVGWIVDFFLIIFKPDKYPVKKKLPRGTP
jgi:hypothetical protein